MEEFQARNGWADPGRFRKTQLNQKSTEDDDTEEKARTILLAKKREAR